MTFYRVNGLIPNGFPHSEGYKFEQYNVSNKLCIILIDFNY